VTLAAPQGVLAAEHAATTEDLPAFTTFKTKDKVCAGLHERTTAVLYHAVSCIPAEGSCTACKNVPASVSLLAFCAPAHLDHDNEVGTCTGDLGVDLQSQHTMQSEKLLGNNSS